MSERDEPANQPPPEPPKAKPAPRRMPGQSWSSLIDEKIRSAQEGGAFDDLSVAGRPQVLDENPYAKDRRLEFHVLKSNDMAPREVSLGSEVDQDLAKAQRLLDILRHRRDVILRRRFVTARDRRAYNILLKKTAASYEALLQEARSKILSLNIIAPALMHRSPLDVAEYMRVFHKEFSPMAE